EEEIRRQEQVVAEATAALARLRNGPLPEEIDQARARLRQGDAEYRKVAAGARPGGIAQARAAERTARARLDQAMRGRTREEKAQAKARLDAARTQEAMAGSDVKRKQALFEKGFVSGQDMEHTLTAWRDAQAKRREQEEAWRRAELGTPAEELEQARQAYQPSESGP